MVGDSSGRIGTVDLDSGATTVLFDSGRSWFDIALDSSGQLYGVSSNTIYSIDGSTGAASAVLSISNSNNVNALAFDSDSFLFSLDTNGVLSKIDLTSNTVTQVGTNASSDGDVVFIGDQLFAAANGDIVRINPDTGATTTIADLDRSDTFGLSVSDSGQLIGYASSTVYSVDTDTGTTTTLQTLDGTSLGSIFGATSDNDPISSAVTGSGEGDSLVGSNNPDKLVGNAGNDTITSGSGADLIYGNTGTDLIYGNSGSDEIFGGQQVDTIYGGQQADLIYGNNEADFIYGNFGSDTMYGGKGADTMYGGQDNDTIYGNVGDDVLYGNGGNDLMIGGSGSDIFVISGDDTVSDFSLNDGDRLSASSDSFVSVDTQSGVTLTFGDGSSVFLTGLSSSDISSSILI